MVSVAVSVETLEEKINSLAQALIVVMRQNLELKRKLLELEREIQILKKVMG